MLQPCRYPRCANVAKNKQVLRPRWKELYAARKRQKDEAAALPELPDTMFGWIPILWRIDEKELLASAGLDAFAVRLCVWPLP